MGKTFGNATAISDDTWSVFKNPAGVLWHKESFVTSYYLLHPYIDELDIKTLALALRKSDKLAAFSIFQQGDDRLNIKELAGTYGQQFGQKINMALSIHYRHYAFGDIYDNTSLIYFSFGTQMRLNEKSLLGFSIINPTKQFIDRKNKERLESIFSFAYQYQFSGVFKTSASAEKSSEEVLNLRLIWAYQLSSNFLLQGSYQTLFKRYNLTSSIQIKQLIVAQSIDFDTVFGWHFGIGLCFFPFKKNDKTLLSGL